MMSYKKDLMRWVFFFLLVFLQKNYYYGWRRRTDLLGRYLKTEPHKHAQAGKQRAQDPKTKYRLLFTSGLDLSHKTIAREEVHEQTMLSKRSLFMWASFLVGDKIRSFRRQRIAFCFKQMICGQIRIRWWSLVLWLPQHELSTGSQNRHWQR